MAVKLLNYYTVEYPKSKFPIRLPRSVNISPIFRKLRIINDEFRTDFAHSLAFQKWQEASKMFQIEGIS